MELGGKKEKNTKEMQLQHTDGGYKKKKKGKNLLKQKKL